MAFRRYRRRGSRGLWLPTVNGRENNSVLVTTAAVGFATNYTITNIIADGLDFPPNTSTLAGFAAASLALVSRPTWMLKRIVGQVFAHSDEAAAGGQERFAFFGIIKDRVDEVGNVDVSKWNPFQEDTTQQRWLFRRFWHLLGNTPLTPTTDVRSSNVSFGGLHQGPHIDCKMKARVEYGERVFLVFGAQNGAGNSATNTRFEPFLRLFGNTGLQGGQR